MLRLLARRTPLGLALAAFRLWRRLPPAQRRALIATTRKQGPRVAAFVAAKRRRRG